METTDPTDTVLTRRRLLESAGAAGVALAVGGTLGVGRGLAAVTTESASALAASALVLTPEQEEGPFYVALEKIRKNITLGRPGVPLSLKIKVVDATTGKPIKNAACDIWQCDASGVYSDESSEGTVGSTWLRGVQLTDATGLAEFTTIYPGHYQGRTTHIHVKVHIGGTAGGTTYSGGHVSHTGQLLFDDATTTKIYALAPYNAETAARVLNTADHVYTDENGSKVVLKLTPLGSAPADGYLGTITLGVNPASTPAPVGVGG
jgi:protocatechuate 3,4-dioxygenase beta subunit